MSGPNVVEALHKCKTCGFYENSCWCGAPRTLALYEARLIWANITHPVSDDIDKQIDRVLNEPQRWLSFAKQLERELESAEKKIAEMEGANKTVQWWGGTGHLLE